MLPREWIFDFFDRGQPALWLEHVALLAFCLGQLENGKALTPGGRIDGLGDDAALVVGKLGLGAKHVDEEGFGRWRYYLDHLHSNQLLRVERLRDASGE